MRRPSFQQGLLCVGVHLPPQRNSPLRNIDSELDQFCKRSGPEPLQVVSGQTSCRYDNRDIHTLGKTKYKIFPRVVICIYKFLSLYLPRGP